MKLGFDLLLWTTHVTDEHWPIIEKLKATGYDGVEIPMFEGEVAHYEKLGRRLRDARPRRRPASASCRGGSAISPDTAERAKALDHIKWLIDCTAAIGGDVGRRPVPPAARRVLGHGPDRRRGRRGAPRSTRRRRSTPRRSGVTYAVEPLNRFECYFLNTMEQAADAGARRVDEPNYGYLFDTFHTNIEENDVPALIGKTIGAINHVHITENNRGVPGAGHIRFQPIFDALRRRRLRRLDDHRSLRLGAARPCRRDQDLAPDLPLGGGRLRARPQVHADGWAKAA